MKNDTRQPLAAPYRADRATAASGIVVRMAVDDLRQKSAAAAHGMSVYVWSAFSTWTRVGPKTPPIKARFGSGLPSHRVGHLRRSRGI